MVRPEGTGRAFQFGGVGDWLIIEIRRASWGGGA